MARLGVPVGGLMRRLRAIEDRPGRPVKRDTSELGGTIYNRARPMRAVEGSLGRSLRGSRENRKGFARDNGPSREIDCEAIER